MRQVCAAVLILATIASPGASQVAPLVPHPGDRVRVWEAKRRLIGVLDALQADSLLLHGRPPLSLVPIQRLDIAVGRKGHTLEGLALGFLVGGVVGVVAANSATANEGIESIGKAVAIWFGVWAGSTVIGGVIGGEMKSDRWQRVIPWPPSSDPSLSSPRFGRRRFTALVRIPI